MGKTNYKIKSYSQKAVEDEITNLVNEAKQDRKNYHTEKNLLHNEEISFTKIRIDKDYLRYYTENNRTVGDCRHFTQKENDELPDDYFSYKNIDNTEVQQNYHSIIYKQADVDVIVDAYRIQKEQRDPIYITTKGVVANGNTRLSVIREKMDEWHYVDCYVYDDKYHDNWHLIESHTSQKDNIKDFRQPDPWYSKYDTYQKYKKWGMNEEVIARMMNYYKGNSSSPDIKSLKDDVNKCILAQEFLDHDLTDEFYIFEDLKKMGSDSGGQVFTTLHQRLNVWEPKIEPMLFLKLKNSAFHLLSYSHTKKIAHKANSVHLAVSRLFSAENIQRLKIDQADQELRGEQPTIEPTNMTLEEKHKFHAEQIDAAVAAYEIKKSEKETKFSQDKLQSAMKEIEQAITALNEKSYVKDIDEISGKIKDKLEELNSKIDKLDLS